MMDELLPIASSVERPSLERLEKYLNHHGIQCQLRQNERNAEKFQLLVAAEELTKAQTLLSEIAYSSRDLDKADEVVEINFDGTERLEVASWLQVLLDEQNHDGSPIYFFQDEYEAVLDKLHSSGHVEIPVFILKGLKTFIPQGAKRSLTGQGLQEFFSLIEAVAESNE